MRGGQTVIGMADPLGHAAEAQALAQRGVTLFALELMPRTTRAQSMDVLSSHGHGGRLSGGAVGGHDAAQDVSDDDDRGRHADAGQGFHRRGRSRRLAGHRQARRLGAVVTAYDVRPVVKEQVQSLGAKFVELDLARPRCANRRRLCQGDGRRILSPAARNDEARRGRKRRGDHHRRRAGPEGADAGHGRDGRRHGARIGRGRPGGRTGRQLRADPARAKPW